MTNITARSGHGADIQEAVDQCVVGDAALIPDVDQSLYDVGETWVRIVIPAGVSIFGAPSLRTSGLPVPFYGMNPNDQVLQYKTTLRMPFEAPMDSQWFQFVGNSDPAKPSRISDIHMVGYREIDINSVTMYSGVAMSEVMDFRVDHIWLQSLGRGMGVGGGYNAPCRGVIDHCRLENNYGIPAPYESITVGYGILVTRGESSDWWDPNIDNVVGHYNDNTVFIEDSYLRRWRHCISANNGVHYVARHNTFGEGNYGNNLCDAHGPYVKVGTRAIELYNNDFQNPLLFSRNPAIEGARCNPIASFIRGGGGVVFNNRLYPYVYADMGDSCRTAQGWYIFMNLRNDNPNVPQCFTKDVWIWDNDDGGAQYHVYEYDPAGPGGDVGDVRYTLGPKPNYTPYPYPHPLTQGIPYHPVSIGAIDRGGAVITEPLPFKIRRV